MLKVVGELLKRNVAVESVEVLRKKIKEYKNVYQQELTKVGKKEVKQEPTFINLNLRGLRGLIFS
jgi:hypothetical protein